MLIEQRQKRKRKLRGIVFILVAVLVAFFLYQSFAGKNFPNIATTSISKPQNVLSSPNVIKPNSLKEAVEKSLEGTKGTYGVFIKNLKTNESFSINEHKIYEAGSLYKLWIMVTAFKKIERGSLADDEILSGDVAALNKKFNIDPDLAEQNEGEITLTVAAALEQMITISHNYASLLLTEKISLSQVASFLKENGFNESIVGINGESPSTTASDIALFFEKLYKGQLSSPESTQKMLDLLKRQKLNDKLPQGLPQGISIAHKTGEINYATHDAGIIFSEKGDYIVAVLSESDYPPGSEERIATISKAVYDYFNTH